MGSVFNDDFHDEFGMRPLGYMPYGGAEFGEIEAIARAVGDGDDNAFHEAWVAAGDRHVDDAQAALEAGHATSARELFLRASSLYGSSLHPIYGAPVDRRLAAAFRKQIAAFDRGLALCDPPVEPLRIPFEGTTLPGYFSPAAGHESDVRPLVVFTNGYDATVTDMYFASAVAASRRSYHSLIYDGPGQGEMLIEHGMRLRPDWETVIAAVVDFAETLPAVDQDRIAVSGWSLGGHLAPRAASGDHRLAACIADPGLWSVAATARGFAAGMGATQEATADFRLLDQAVLDRIWKAVCENRRLRWTIVQRGFWVNGVDTLRDYLCDIERYTMDGRAEAIRCPTLLVAGSDDPLAATAGTFFEALTCRKDLIRLTAADGAGDHCEMKNRTMLNRRVFDWLDDVFAVA